MHTNIEDVAALFSIFSTLSGMLVKALRYMRQRRSSDTGTLLKQLFPDDVPASIAPRHQPMIPHPLVTIMSSVSLLIIICSGTPLAFNRFFIKEMAFLFSGIALVLGTMIAWHHKQWGWFFACLFVGPFATFWYGMFGSVP